MSYLDQVNIAISPYIGRSQKAIDFYINNKDKFGENGSLFLALAHGPTNGWTNNTPEIPNLNTIELDNVFKFIWYDKMYFVQSDIDGKLNVGNLTWSLISNPGTDEEYFRNVRNAGCRWLYVEFNTTDDTDRNGDTDKTIRQIGLYSNLILNENVGTDYTVYLPSNSEINTVSDSSDNRYYNGILTLIQNKSDYEATSNVHYSFILEF